MGLNYLELDAETRQFMRQELERDLREGTLALSQRLSRRGRADFPTLLRQAIESLEDSDATLARHLGSQGRMEAFEPQRGNSRRIGRVPMPADAHEVLAEYEFNRLYMRAICLRALAHGQTQVQVYRARPAVSQKHRSVHLEDQFLSAETVLQDLRRNAGRSTETGLGRPRSGLSIRTGTEVRAASESPSTVGVGAP